MKEVLLITMEQRHNLRNIPDVMFSPSPIRKYLSKLQCIQFVNYYDYIDL